MTRALLIAASALAIVALAANDIRPSRSIDVSSDFSRPTPYFSILGPPTRVGEEEHAHSFFGEPVYFDLRLPVWFSRAKVEVVWNKDSRLPEPSLGVALDPSDDRIEGGFALYELTRAATSEGGMVSKVDLDLASLPRSRYGYRLFFSVPGVNADTPFHLFRVTVRARRGPFAAELRRVVRTYLRI